ncbi:cytochrome c biogenesis CcdA family protein [Actinomyces sp. B33]|uniref:cytochrome c biogenesis CcdA family protein n=1 Tax=Actinomyces sp. B33 TaxID=2942131 RepID=UPI002340F4A5|nr:cytochrome c biogenesis CcdA family protein [Actinomyces sp. B33]MDC4233641.1 cytochrome c biogenesis CcdA family protein [Actinomyces sp. B33]
MSDIAPIAALLGGVLTLVAPCSVMLLPAFFAYAFASPTTLIARTATFWLGLLAVLLPLGMAASTLGAVLRDHMGLITRIGAAIVIVLGILQALAVETPRWPRPRARAQADRDSSKPLAVFLLGAAYGLAGVGCAGPILGAVLVSAGLGGDPARGALLMTLYATGMAAPLGALALAWQTAGDRTRRLLRPRPLTLLGRATTWTNAVSGAILVALGLGMLVVGPTNPLGSLVGSERLAAWEERIIDLGARMPWWLIAVSVALLVAAVWAMRPQRTRNGPHPEG